ncbi:MAG: FAD-binding oxidoreductase [Candidatus Dormibacteraeota bacterium]|nr:FAD-binding oxidoreductase [Candidatus Dormibacteraeota bacterium]MBV9524620.1 FAD-binding oxidoreductase [Candidatus Dormibacteraeota bacterium]
MPPADSASRDGADVVVIGAGVIGLAVAYELRRAGVRDVVVFEAQPAPGMGSTARANGGVRAQFATAANIAFSQFTIEQLAGLDERSGGRVGLRRIGYLFLAGESTAAQLQSNVSLQQDMGVAVRMLPASAVLELAPFVRIAGLLAASFCPDDGVIDPHGVAAALCDAGRELGVRYRTSTRVTALEQTRAGARVHTDSGAVDASWVVNAAGPAAAQVASLAGLELEVHPHRHNLVVTEPVPGIMPSTPMCVDMDTGLHVRGEAGGALIGCPDPARTPTTDTTFDPLYLELLATRVGNRFPLLDVASINMRKCWAGLYPETPDHAAIIGTFNSAPWFIQCCGFGGHGIMHSLAAGRAVSELARHGTCATFDLSPLRPARFQEGATAAETAVL